MRTVSPSRRETPAVPSEGRVVDLGPVDQVLLGDRATVRLGVDGSEVVLVRGRKRILAFENRCPHAGNRLDGATVRGRTVTCPGHGYRFDLTSGSCVRRARRPPPLRLYRAWVAEGRLFVAM